MADWTRLLQLNAGRRNVEHRQVDFVGKVRVSGLTDRRHACENKSFGNVCSSGNCGAEVQEFRLVAAHQRQPQLRTTARIFSKILALNHTPGDLQALIRREQGLR
ncbi:unnamed protein product [Soboliphyme baturini]|uniref:Uncharacterized protein n=1 Tax=Soboliphyme baturini TaxID=241478 RepID=A0A183IBQ5_9BILA|nr:unnamed protein product [Soboliphyme baturini]